MDEVKKTKLAGGPDKTVTWIWLDRETGGQLKVEYYDFSEAAQRLFGNDIAYIITVHEMDKLLSTVNQNENSLILWMEQYFKSYFGIKKWLEENGIGFDIQIEGWA
jgi:hypothetical protein